MGMEGSFSASGVEENEKSPRRTTPLSGNRSRAEKLLTCQGRIDEILIMWWQLHVFLAETLHTFDGSGTRTCAPQPCIAV